jgi:hypothetical protein
MRDENKFRALFDGSSAVLLVEGEKTDSDPITGVSVFAAHILRKSQEKGFTSAFWFCGVDGSADADDMVRNLVCQLLMRRNIELPSGKPPTDYDELVELLCTCVRQQLAINSVCCVLDSIHRVSTSKCQKLIEKLIACATENTSKYNLVLVVTSTSYIPPMKGGQSITQRINVEEKVWEEAEKQAPNAPVQESSKGKKRR